MRWLLTGLTVGAVAGTATADGGLVSPPGWFGPGPAWGRWNDPGPGNGWNYYGVQDGPYVAAGAAPWGGRVWGGPGWRWFGPPGAFGSFWTNGRSLYGPPVPTYGPTPGVFGAADDDKRFFRNPPPTSGFYMGLGWAGTRSPSPRYFTPNVSVHPAPAPSVSVMQAPPAVTAEGSPCIRLAVKLPDPGADVWVEQVAMKQKGTDRVFESPPLTAGDYKYTIVARWTADGRDKAESRVVVAKPGQTVQIDFNRPDEPAAQTAGK